MYTRLFYGTIQEGKSEEALQILRDFAQRIKQRRGCILNQVLQNGNEVVGISTWETKEDLASYADSDMARDLFTQITPLFMGRPTARSYDVKLSQWDQAMAKTV